MLVSIGFNSQVFQIWLTIVLLFCPFMTWSIGLPRHEHNRICFQALAATTFLKLYFLFKTWHPKFWNVSFFSTPFPSLDNDRPIQDLAFQVLNSVWVFKFPHQTQLRIMSFCSWSSMTWIQVNMIVKTWQPQVWNLTLFFQDLAWQVLNRYIVATPCHQVMTMIATFKTWLPKSWHLLG